MTIKPTADHVVIRPDKLPEEVKTASGIILTSPSKEKDPPERGLVIAIGHACEGIEVGDYVLYGKYDFDFFKHEGEDLQIGKGDKVLAILQV